MSEQKTTYDEGFYNDQMSGSYASAKLYIKHLSEIYLPSSVVDVGCGRGTWLSAFSEAGVQRVVGLDGPWNSQGKMVNPNIQFHEADLNRPIKLQNAEKFDLATSLEVAEHLKPESAITFVKSLTDLSDLIMFGSAYTAQGGADHINEQPHSYWARLFSSYEFVPFDFFRSKFWGDSGVEWWYRQNTFLYAKKDSAAYNLITKSISPMAHIDFMDCVHPELFSKILINGDPKMHSFMGQLSLTVLAFKRSIKNRLSNN